MSYTAEEIITTPQKRMRYIGTIDLNIWADTDEEAQQIGNEVCKRINDQDDCHATLQSLIERPFGPRSHREIKINH